MKRVDGQWLKLNIIIQFNNSEDEFRSRNFDSVHIYNISYFIFIFIIDFIYVLYLNICL